MIDETTPETSDAASALSAPVLTVDGLTIGIGSRNSVKSIVKGISLALTPGRVQGLGQDGHVACDVGFVAEQCCCGGARSA